MLKENIHSLYQEALYARVTDKLSYDIIGLVGLIDRVKRAAQRYIRSERQLTDIIRVNDIAASAIKERLSKPVVAPCDNDSLIIAGRCSGFEHNTDLVTQNSGIVTAALQMHGGGFNIPNINDVSISSFSDHSTINLPLEVQSTEQRPPIINQYDPLMTSASLNRSRTVEGPMLADLRGTRLAIESDISIADFPTAIYCLNNIQFIPSEFNNGLQVVAENIDLWRANLITRINLYSSAIADLQTSSNATSYACNLNA